MAAATFMGILLGLEREMDATYENERKPDARLSKSSARCQDIPGSCLEAGWNDAKAGKPLSKNNWTGEIPERHKEP
jgi:hypothetical protein